MKRFQKRKIALGTSDVVGKMTKHKQPEMEKYDTGIKLLFIIFTVFDQMKFDFSKFLFLLTCSNCQGNVAAGGTAKAPKNALHPVSI